MPPERTRDTNLETDGVLVRPIGGQIYLIEEKDLEAWFADEEALAERSPLAGLVNRH